MREKLVGARVGGFVGKRNARVDLDLNVGVDRRRLRDGENLRVDQLVPEAGERIELVITNKNPMPHPMHLHGHEFQVVEIDGTPLQSVVYTHGGLGVAGNGTNELNQAYDARVVGDFTGLTVPSM